MLLMRQKLELPWGAQTAIARRLGVHPSLVTRRLSGERPWPLREALAFIEILRSDYGINCSVEDLLTETTTEQASDPSGRAVAVEGGSHG